MRFEGEVVGVLAASGTRVVWAAEGEMRERGGRWRAGRVEGGWFSASEDWGDGVGESTPSFEVGRGDAGGGDFSSGVGDGWFRVGDSTFLGCSAMKDEFDDSECD